MGVVTVCIVNVLIYLFASTFAVEKKKFHNREDVFPKLSESHHNSLYHVDLRSQTQLQKLDTDQNSTSSCHCTCNCNCQPNRDYGLRPICPSYYPNCDRWSLERSRDCQELYQRGYNRTGVYVIHPNGLPQEIYVLCDMETEGGGWTFIQRRVSGGVDFFCDWSDYKKGFGDLNGNFWIGNDNIHALTAQGNYQLRIDFTLFDKNKTFATYSTFNVGDENSGYMLRAGGYSGTAADSLSYHSGAKFSAKDRDNDVAEGSCAEWYKGGWWYTGCYDSNLNGVYGSMPGGQGIAWLALSRVSRSIVYADMKVKQQ